MSQRPEEITIETPALRLAARAWGPADGLPCLALHGWLDNAASFDALAPHLPQLRLVCLDLPGHGRSAALPAGHSYGFIDTVAHVHAATVALGWNRYCLIGHSLGAAVASVLAGVVPGRIRRLVLLEGLGPVTEDAKHAAERLARAFAEEARKEGRSAPVYATPNDAARRLETSMSRLSAAAADTLVTRGLREVEGGFTWCSDPRLRLPSRQRLGEEQVLAFLRAIACPVLLVRGTSGFPFAPTARSARVAALADSVLIELEGGHHLHLDTPEPVALAIREHLAALVDAH